MRCSFKCLRLAASVMLLLALAVSLGALRPGDASANPGATLRAGDIIAVDFYERVLKVDPATGASEVISSGGLFYRPQHAALKYGGDGRVTDIFVSNTEAGNIIRLDPATGAQSLVTSGGILVKPRKLVVDSKGDILVADSVAARVIRVNPSTGAQSIVSSGSYAHGLAIERTGNLIASDWDRREVVRIDPSTGTKTVLSRGPFDEGPVSVAVERDGSIVVAEAQYYGRGTVSRLDPATGARVVISTGGYLSMPFGLALDGNGNIIIGDYNAPGGAAVIRIDPGTGTQIVVSRAVGTVHGVAVVASPTVVDTTPPVIDPTLTGILGNGDWYRSDVGLGWSVTDPESEVTSKTGCDSSTATADTAGTTFTCTATSAGGTASKSATVKRDATPPTIAYSGNAGTYTVDQIVNITCSASDNLSGIASDSCQNIVGPAYSLPLGANTFSATATDVAGNVGSGSTTFTVKVTGASLGALVQSFVSQPGVASSMLAKLRAAEAAAARGNASAKAGAIGAFINEVQAQSGKTLTAEQAATLIRLARAM